MQCEYSVKARRTNTHQLLVAKQGPMMPMEGIESHLLAIVLHTSMMRQPLTPMQALEVANFFLWDSVKKRRNQGVEKDIYSKNTHNSGLGRKYWLNCYKRHKDVLSAKKVA